MLTFSRANYVFLALLATRGLRKTSRDSLSGSREAGAHRKLRRRANTFPVTEGSGRAGACAELPWLALFRGHIKEPKSVEQAHCLDVDWQQHSDTCSSRPGTEAFLQLSHSTRELWVGVKQLENHKPTTGWLSEMTGGFCFEPACEECRYLNAAAFFIRIVVGAFWRLCPFGL